MAHQGAHQLAMPVECVPDSDFECDLPGWPWEQDWFLEFDMLCPAVDHQQPGDSNTLSSPELPHMGGMTGGGMTLSPDVKGTTGRDASCTHIPQTGATPCSQASHAACGPQQGETAAANAIGYVPASHVSLSAGVHTVARTSPVGGTQQQPETWQQRTGGRNTAGGRKTVKTEGRRKLSKNKLEVGGWHMGTGGCG